MDNLYYTISGLPFHALVVHFAVVLLPIATFAFLVAIYIPRFRNKYAFASIFGIFVGAGSAFVAKQSGEALASHIGNPVTHAKYGNLLPLFAFLLFLISVLWYRSKMGKNSKSITLLGHASAVVAIGVISLTLVVGHTGAEAVWKNRLPQSNQAKSQQSTGSTSSGSTSAKAGITMAEVKKHATAANCWAAIDGNVYNLTNWISKHPGGPGVIKTLCGTDGSQMFNQQHGGQGRPVAELKNYKVGALG